MLRSLAWSLGLCLFAAATYAEVPSGPGDWPQWRGPKRDGISTDTKLLKEWPKEGPPVLWQVDTAGVGYSSLAVKSGRIYTQGDIAGVEHVICFDAKNGEVLWAVQPEPVAALLATRITDEFARIDKDKSGKIDELEALGRFGWEWNKFNAPADGEAAQIIATRVAFVFDKLDADGDGKLTYTEGAPGLRDEFERADAEDKTADAEAIAAARTAEYLKLDKDGDGKLAKSEVKQTHLDRQFGRIDQKDPSNGDKADELLTADEIKASLLKHEAGRDGVVTKAELEKHYANRGAKGDGELTADELKVAVGGYRNGMGDGPRGTPTVDGERVYVEGGNGDVTCLEAATGKTVWHVNLPKQFGGGVPGWGYSESPLVVDNLVIVTPGGKQGTLLALDKTTGEKVWQSGAVSQGAHYSSPVVAEIHGVKQIVQFARESVFGVTLAEGKPLWSYQAPANGTANCCDPIVSGEYVFAASAYGTGGGLVRIVSKDGQQSAEEVFFEKKMQCHHGGMIKIGDHLYSNAAGSLICMEFSTGDIAWQARASGKGSLCAADGMLYLLGEGHDLVLADATPEEYRERGRIKLKEHGRPAWAHPVVAGGVLYVRDQQSLTAYDIRAK